LDLAILQNNILHVDLQKSVERANLLRDESMLLEVSFDDSPSVIAVNRPIGVYRVVISKAGVSEEL
jgi:hypothetical protein